MRPVGIIPAGLFCVVNCVGVSLWAAVICGAKLAIGGYLLHDGKKLILIANNLNNRLTQDAKVIKNNLNIR